VTKRGPLEPPRLKQSVDRVLPEGHEEEPKTARTKDTEEGRERKNVSAWPRKNIRKTITARGGGGEFEGEGGVL